jgi:N-acetylglucosaminyldiphosphoundecaprenol N-acetyl-beta-D-mannosaminyltransferase
VSAEVSPIGRVFGLSISAMLPEQIVAHALAEPRSINTGVRLVVTPNIEHIARLRTDLALRSAYGAADIIVCDGWPVCGYARLRGYPVRRVTGYDIATQLMGASTISCRHRLFFVLDSADTVFELQAWAARRGLDGQVMTAVPSFGFEHDEGACRGLAAQIHAHGTSLLVMGVGAPRSEIFVHRHRDLLPPCWAFCLGGAVKAELGILRRAPKPLRRLGLEWLWRLAHEPRRLARRYFESSGAFLVAIADDLRSPRIRSQ